MSWPPRWYTPSQPQEKVHADVLWRNHQSKSSCQTKGSESDNESWTQIFFSLHTAIAAGKSGKIDFEEGAYNDNPVVVRSRWKRGWYNVFFITCATIYYFFYRLCIDASYYAALCSTTGTVYKLLIDRSHQLVRPVLVRSSIALRSFFVLYVPSTAKLTGLTGHAWELIQPHEYLKYIHIYKYISYPNLRPFIMGENAIGYFCARINSTDIRRYLSQSQDLRDSQSWLISIPGYSRDSQPAQISRSTH
jgi:hypothetical protein